MARRHDHTREELRELALKAARKLALRDGLRGLTIRAIAGEISYSVGTLYNVFDDQNDMIVQLNGGMLDDLRQHMEAVERPGDPLVYLTNLATAYLKFTSEHARLWGLLFEHRLPEGKDLPRWYQEKLGHLLQLVEHALCAAVPEGGRDQAQDMARILWASLHGIATLAQSGKLGVVSARTAEEMARALVVDFVEGARVRLEQQ